MLEKINLFPKTKAIWEKKAKTRRWIQIGSTVFLVVYLIFLSFLFSYFLILNGEMASAQTKIENYEKQIEMLQGRETKQLLLKEKLKELVEILKSGQEPEKALQDIQSLTLEGITLTSFNYLEKELKVEGEAENALVFDALVKGLEVSGKDDFNQVLFKSVNKMENGDYQFEFLVKK